MSKYILILIVSLFSSTIFGQSTLPYMKNNQLMVDDKPFIMIGGELHNSSASSVEYMEPLWEKLRWLNLNTVLATITWDQFEPEEGTYDYEMIDYLIEESEINGLKLVVVWFGSWKNGQSSYSPLWVRKDTKRFPRAETSEGVLMETLSVFSQETLNADKAAFTALMQRIKEKDKSHTVIMVQPENEVGLFQDIDYRKEVLKKYNGEVPENLMDYMSGNKDHLKEELSSVWEAAGSKKSGTWKEVFGDNPQSKEFFMAWHYASFINEIAESGRNVLDLPMFVNAWIVQKDDDLPGVYPNGGPVSRVMDIYKAAGPSIDVVSPDIYLPNYKEIYAMYYREHDNPLLVPESSLDAARAFYAFGEFDGICFSPFGIEDADGDVLFSASYGVLNELQPIITKYQRTGMMRGIHLTNDFQDDVKIIDDYEVRFKIQDPDKPAYGLIIKTGEHEFIVSGMNFKAWFSRPSGKNKITYIGQVAEGRFEDGEWIETRWLNGDETYHNELFRALGRQINVNDQFERKETITEVGDEDQFVYSPGSVGAIDTPGVYKVLLYERPSKR